MAGTAEDHDASADIFYICEKSLKTIQEKLKLKEEITQEMVNELTFPENLPDDEMMVPVDMRGVGEDFDDVEHMVEKLGPKGTAEGFVKARAYFDENKEKEPEEERPKPMTAKEWRDVLDEEDADLMGDNLEGLEEEFMEGEEEEAPEDDDEEAEPAAKKAKTA